MIQGCPISGVVGLLLFSSDLFTPSMFRATISSCFSQASGLLLSAFFHPPCSEDVGRFEMGKAKDLFAWCIIVLWNYLLQDVTVFTDLVWEKGIKQIYGGGESTGCPLAVMAM